MKAFWAALLLIGLLLAINHNANAAQFKAFSFINPTVTSLMVSNAVIGATNMVSVGRTTNYAGAQYTNYVGSHYICGTNSSADAVNLLGDVPLDPFNDGRPLPYVLTAADTATTNYANVNVAIKLVGVNAAANSAVTFRFIPVYDGENESTLAADVISVAVTATGTTPVVHNARIPVGRLIGAKALRLRDVFNADEDANSAVWVSSIKLTGFAQ